MEFWAPGKPFNPNLTILFIAYLGIWFYVLKVWWHALNNTAYFKYKIFHFVKRWGSIILERRISIKIQIAPKGTPLFNYTNKDENIIDAIYEDIENCK